MYENPSEHPFPREEPRAEIRQFAGGMREIYVALQQEGFTAAEAMHIVGVTISAGIAGAGGGQS